MSLHSSILLAQMFERFSWTAQIFTTNAHTFYSGQLFLQKCDFITEISLSFLLHIVGRNKK